MLCIYIRLSSRVLLDLHLAWAPVAFFTTRLRSQYCSVKGSPESDGSWLCCTTCLFAVQFKRLTICSAHGVILEFSPYFIKALRLNDFLQNILLKRQIQPLAWSVTLFVTILYNKNQPVRNPYVQAVRLTC